MGHLQDNGWMRCHFCGMGNEVGVWERSWKKADR